MIYPVLRAIAEQAQSEGKSRLANQLYAQQQSWIGSVMPVIKINGRVEVLS